MEMQENTLDSQWFHRFYLRPKATGAFTRVDLLTAVCAVVLMTAALLPAVGKARRNARAAVCTCNLRHITKALNLYAADNNDQYPESVATIGFGSGWSWMEPTMLTNYKRRSPTLNRSVSAYLRPYIRDGKVFHCPGAPAKSKYLQHAWNAGDDWGNPETAFPTDPLSGTYCLYWNYIGWLEGRDYPFMGPRNSAAGRSQSTLLVADYFGYDHWRSPDAWGSCEYFTGASVTEGTLLSAPYWSGQPGTPARPYIRLHAGYTDGRVETFGSSEVIAMKVSVTSDGTVPYPHGAGPGVFYLPQNALH